RTRLQQGEGSRDVDVVSRQRLVHGLLHARQRGEVNYGLNVAEANLDHLGVSYISKCEVQPPALPDIAKILELPAGHVVDDRDFIPLRDEPLDEVAPDEARPSGD